MKLILICLTLFFSVMNFSHGFVATKNANTGVPLSWAGNPPKPVFYMNWVNNDGIGYIDIFRSMTNSLQRWKHTGAANVDFDYWQGANTATPTRASFDNKNAMFFTSNSVDSLFPGTLGATWVVYSGGTILETDVLLNDTDYNFTLNESDTLSDGGDNSVYIGNVVTHELGHAFGLSHSASLQSTMIYLEHKGTAKPSCDDIQGMASQYPLSSYTSARGSITSKVVKDTTDIFGAHLVAVSKTRGTVIAGAISESDGSVTIPNLEPGDYYLFVEPFGTTTPISALCGGSAAGCHYGTVNSNTICSGNPFKRTFVEASTGVPQKVTVSAGSSTLVSNISVGCSDYSGGTPATSSGAAASIISNNGGSEVEAAATMIMGGEGTDHYYKLENVSGDIKVNVSSYGLYSPFDPEVTILDSGGSSVATGVVATDNIFTHSSGFTNYDAMASLDNATASDYYVKVTNKADLSGSPELYPAGQVSQQIDSLSYYLVSVTINDSTAILSELESNGRCEKVDTFPAFEDKGPPPEQDGSAAPPAPTVVNGDGVDGGCFGTLGPPNNDDGFQMPGPSALFSIWGLALMMFVMRFTLKLWERKE